LIYYSHCLKICIHARLIYGKRAFFIFQRLKAAPSQPSEDAASIYAFADLHMNCLSAL
jgi:hypothetical protein